jgi:cysteine synthase
VCDRVMKVMDEPAFAMVKRLAAEEGVFAGSSAGAMLCAVVDLARELGAGKRVVTVIPDSAERYLSKGLLD